jgi:hypothetical protein
MFRYHAENPDTLGRVALYRIAPHRIALQRIVLQPQAARVPHSLERLTAEYAEILEKICSAMSACSAVNSL